MIRIEDNDLPITVAEKIIRGVKPYNPTPIMEALVKGLTGNADDCRTIDMFDLEEIREIAVYLMVYYNAHKEVDEVEQ